MAKEIICPHCKKGLHPANGFEHDADLNMLCNYCKLIIFPVSREVENKIKYTLQTSQSQVHSHYKKECLPIRLQNSPIVIEPSTSHYGYEMYPD